MSGEVNCDVKGLVHCDVGAVMNYSNCVIEEGKANGDKGENNTTLMWQYIKVRINTLSVRVTTLVYDY